MLPILLVLLIVSIALAGAGVIWLVASQALSPLVATVGSGVVIVFCLGLLLLLFARGRVRRLERELRTVRRSEGIRQRAPLRFGTEDGAAGGHSNAPLVHGLSSDRPPSAQDGLGAGRGSGASAKASGDQNLLDEAVMAMLRGGDPLLLAEPIVSMTRNTTLGYRLAAGWRANPDIRGEAKGAAVPTDRLGLPALAGLTLSLVRCALRLDGTKFGEGVFVEIDLPPPVLEHRETMRDLVRDVEGSLEAVLDADLEAGSKAAQDKELEAPAPNAVTAGSNEADERRNTGGMAGIEGESEAQLLPPSDAAAPVSHVTAPAPALAFRVQTAALDPLAGGRLEDVTEAGAWLVETGVALGALSAELADELARRGVRALGADARSASEDAHAKRGLALLLEANIAPRAEAISDEAVLVDCAELGFENLSGPLIGASRPLRDDVLRE